jgi:hypothetical protein
MRDEINAYQQQLKKSPSIAGAQHCCTPGPQDFQIQVPAYVTDYSPVAS